MKLKVTKANVWAAAIEDRAGGLAEKLAPLAAAAIGRKFVCHLALDTADDATKAAGILKKLS